MASFALTRNIASDGTSGIRAASETSIQRIRTNTDVRAYKQ